MDCHAAQPSYSALFLEIGDFTSSVIRCCVRVPLRTLLCYGGHAGILLGFPDSSFRRLVCTAFRGYGIHESLDPLQPSGGPFPHPPMSKINFPRSTPRIISNSPPRRQIGESHWNGISPPQRPSNLALMKLPRRLDETPPSQESKLMVRKPF